MTAVEELRDSLKFIGVEGVEDDILASMVEASAALGIKPSDMGDKWIAHSLNNNSMELTFDNWIAFKTELNRSAANRLTRKRPSIAITSPAVNANNSSFSQSIVNSKSVSSPFGTRTPLAPLNQQTLFQPLEPSEVSTPMSSDPAAVGTTVFQYSSPILPSNSQALCLEDNWWGSDEVVPSKTSINVINKAPEPFRYMVQKPSEIVLSLNDHLEWLEREAFPRPVEPGTEGNEQEKTIKTAENIPESTRIVGRFVVAASNEVQEGNGSGVALQGSLESMAGAEIPLHVLPTAINGFSVCQGQVVGVSGTSAQASKRLFVAENIMLPSLPPPFVSKSPTKDNDFVALIAAGPFTVGGKTGSINTGIANLTTLVRRFKPTLVILIGPFASSSVTSNLAGHLSAATKMDMQFCFIPSHSDNIDNGFQLPPVYPTRPFDNFKGLTKVVETENNYGISTCDPGVFDVNGAMICATSVDTLRHLAASELHFGGPAAGGDRLARLASTTVYQRCMYPMYPQAQSVPVDWLLWRKMATFSNLPSLVVLPSDLNPFIAPFSVPTGGSSQSSQQKSQGPFPLLINPGRVSRRRAAVVRWSAKDAAFTAGRIVRL